MRRTKQKIWIVDDDEMIGTLVSDYLRAKTCYTPYYFSSPSKALKTLRWVKPEIILLDWNMPEYTGMEFIERLSKKPRTQKIPIFMLTGCKSGEEFETACLSNIQGYITKPVHLSSLAQRLDFFFEQKN